MHSFQLLPSLFFIASFTISLYAAAWEHTKIPSHDEVRCLSASGSMVLAGLDNGFSYSPDSGNTWFEGITATYNASATMRYGGTVKQLLPFGSDTVLALLDDRLMVSYDSGCTWDKIQNAGFLVALTIKDTLLFAGSTARRGALVSFDRGATWEQPLNSGIRDLSIISMAALDNTLYAGTRQQGIYISNDNGIQWDTINSGLIQDSAGVYLPVTMLYANSGQLFAVTDSGLFQKKGGIPAWVRIATVMDFMHVTTIMSIGNTLFVGTDNGLYRTNDNGNRWEVTDDGMPSDTLADKPRVFSLTSSNNVLYAGTHRGVYRSTDGGKTWTAANTHSTITSFGSCGNSLFAGSAQGIYVTNDSGNHWSHIPNSPLNSRCFSSTDSFIIAGTGTGWPTTARVIYSSDTGRTWGGDNNGNGLWGAVTSLAVHDSCILAGVNGGHGIYKTRTVPYGWTVSNTGLLHSASTIFPNALICHNNTFFCGTPDNLFRSDTYGSTWEVSDSGVVGTVVAMVSKDATCFAATDSGVFYSNDNGHLWKLSLMMSGITHMIRDKETIFVVIEKSILFSRDNGSTWRTLSGKLPPSTLRALSVHGEYLVAAFIRGSVYRIPLTDALAVSSPPVARSATHRASIALTVNNKNLTLSCSQTSMLRIALFTLTGKKASLVTSRMFPAGTHTLPINQSNLSAGIYLLEVQSASETHRTHFIVMR